MNLQLNAENHIHRSNDTSYHCSESSWSGGTPSPQPFQSPQDGDFHVCTRPRRSMHYRSVSLALTGQKTWLVPPTHCTIIVETKCLKISLTLHWGRWNHQLCLPYLFHQKSWLIITDLGNFKDQSNAKTRSKSMYTCTASSENSRSSTQQFDTQSTQRSDSTHSGQHMFYTTKCHSVALFRAGSKEQFCTQLKARRILSMKKLKFGQLL